MNKIYYSILLLPSYARSSNNIKITFISVALKATVCNAYLVVFSLYLGIKSKKSKNNEEKKKKKKILFW